MEQPSGAAVPDLPVDTAHLAFVRQAMADVVKSGTAPPTTAKLDLGPMMMAGKTGTAQSHTYGGGHGAHGAHGRLGAARPRLVRRLRPLRRAALRHSVLVEHGGFGADAAAPRAREIMKRGAAEGPRHGRPHAARARGEDRAAARRPANSADAAPPPPTVRHARRRTADPRPRATDMSRTALTRPGQRDRLVGEAAEIDWRLILILCAIAGVGA